MSSIAVATRVPAVESQSARFQGAEVRLTPRENGDDRISDAELRHQMNLFNALIMGARKKKIQIL